MNVLFLQIFVCTQTLNYKEYYKNSPASAHDILTPYTFLHTTYTSAIEISNALKKLMTFIS